MIEIDIKAKQPKGFAVQTAKGILTLYGHSFTSPECTVPECCGTEQKATHQSVGNDQSWRIKNSIKVYPNPAKDKVVIDFSQVGKHFGGLIMVHDGTGKHLWREVFSAESQQVVWSTDQVPSGLYFYTVTLNGQAFMSGKISISH